MSGIPGISDKFNSSTVAQLLNTAVLHPTPAKPGDVSVFDKFRETPGHSVVRNSVSLANAENKQQLVIGLLAGAGGVLLLHKLIGDRNKQ